jgi:DNA-binding NarL/FixJ family response regulator
MNERRCVGRGRSAETSERTFVTESARPRVLLADDYAGILVALDRLLRPSCEVVAHVTDGSALLDTITTLQPDVVVVDLFMPNIDGLTTYSRIRQLAPQTKIVVVTAADDEFLREKALDAGASAFVPKPRVVEDLLPAIRSVIASSAEVG